MTAIFLFIGGPNDGERHPVPYDVDTFALDRMTIEGKKTAVYHRKEMTSRDQTFTVFTAEPDMRSYEVVRELMKGYHNPPRN